MPREGKEPHATGYETAELSSEIVPTGRTGPLTPGARVGRFVVLESVGEGGMGLVVAAYDPALDRRVAIKVMRPEVWGGDADEGRQRLLREARAMAKLSHPNVLSVYEVGLIEDQVFVAMEYAPGGTLREWLARQPRSRREILDAFLAAGRGLQVAHEAGLVHRDFKPENVLLGADGGVRVADFGIVGGSHRPGEDDEADDVRLTQTGAAIGTPAYMAPEQFSQRGSVDARADQFAYCVALYEALYCERPFPGTSRAELSRAVREHAVAPAPRGSAVPTWLRDVLLRGLAREPERRFPSMAALLSALSSDPIARRRRRLAIGSGIAVSLALIGLAAFALMRLGDRASLCHVARARLAGVWDDDRRGALRDAFAASGVPYAPDAADRVARLFDEYTAQWAAARRDSCEATRVRGEQSEALLDRRAACFDRRLGELDALVEVMLANPDAALVDRAAEAAANLEPLASCEADALVGGYPPPRDELRAAVEEAQRALDRARAREEAGRYTDGLEVARDAVATARRLDYPPLLAEALFVTGGLAEHAGDPDTARTSFEEALVAAARARDDRLTARTWFRLLFSIAHAQGRPREALALVPAARAALARSPDDPELAALMWDSLGDVHGAAGDHAEAARDFERALERASALPDRHPLHRNILTGLGGEQFALGNYDEALRYHELALAKWRALVGEEHPSYAGALNNVALVAQARGDLDRALASFEKIREIRASALGPDHPEVAAVLNNIGSVRSDREQWAEARDAFAEAARIGEASLGADHPMVAMTNSNLAIALRELGDFGEARRRLELALAVKLERLGPEHRSVGNSRMALAEVWLEQGELREARREVDTAIAVFENASGPPQPLAEARFLKARILWEGGEHRAALRLAREARDVYGDSGPEWASSRDAVDGWIKER